MNTRTTRLVIVIAMTCLVVPGFASSAGAATSELGLSRDGVHWSQNVIDPLFTSPALWVPGDHETASFYARNQSSDKAVLDVEVAGSSVDSLVRTGDLHVSVRGGDRAWTTINTAGTHRVVHSLGLAPGDDARIDVAVEFDPASTNMSQRKALDLHFRVRLTQDTSTGTGSSGASGAADASGSLPDTGGPSGLLLGAGVLTVLVGAIVLLRRGREVHR